MRFSLYYSKQRNGLDKVKGQKSVNMKGEITESREARKVQKKDVKEKTTRRKPVKDNAVKAEIKSLVHSNNVDKKERDSLSYSMLDAELSDNEFAPQTEESSQTLKNRAGTWNKIEKER